MFNIYILKDSTCSVQHRIIGTSHELEKEYLRLTGVSIIHFKMLILIKN
jgi:hypothetical protein